MRRITPQYACEKRGVTHFTLDKWCAYTQAAVKASSVALLYDLPTAECVHQKRTLNSGDCYQMDHVINWIHILPFKGGSSSGINWPLWLNAMKSGRKLEPSRPLQRQKTVTT